VGRWFRLPFVLTAAAAAAADYFCIIYNYMSEHDDAGTALRGTRLFALATTGKSA
jgi:hypothetical protein